MACRDCRIHSKDRPIGALISPQAFLVVIPPHFYHQLTGSTVRVRYSIPTERNERESGFPNHPDYIRPL